MNGVRCDARARWDKKGKGRNGSDAGVIRKYEAQTRILHRCGHLSSGKTSVQFKTRNAAQHEHENTQTLTVNGAIV